MSFIDPHKGSEFRPHPAKFSKSLIPHIAEMIPDDVKVLCDPMAGVGRLDQLGDAYEYHMNEIEPEWASQIDSKHHVTIGDAAKYNIPEGCMVITSPPYGNRMADYFVSKTRPESMKGRYAGDLGRKLTQGSSAAMKFGGTYRDTMTTCYVNIFNQMAGGQLFLLNVSNFISSFQEVNVQGFYLDLFTQNGFTLDRLTPVKTPRDRGRGANANLRVDHEVLMLWRKINTHNLEDLK